MCLTLAYQTVEVRDPKEEKLPERSQAWEKERIKPQGQAGEESAFQETDSNNSENLLDHTERAELRPYLGKVEQYLDLNRLPVCTN